MNLRGGKIKADLPPLKKTKKQPEQIRNSSSMPDLSNIHNNSTVNIDSNPDYEFCNEFENNININDKTISGIDDEDEDESTAKNKSNKSIASESNTDDDADE
jgi:hypothetical protein